MNDQKDNKNLSNSKNQTTYEQYLEKYKKYKAKYISLKNINLQNKIQRGGNIGENYTNEKYWSNWLW